MPKKRRRRAAKQKISRRSTRAGGISSSAPELPSERRSRSCSADSVRRLDLLRDATRLEVPHDDVELRTRVATVARDGLAQDCVVECIADARQSRRNGAVEDAVGAAHFGARDGIRAGPVVVLVTTLKADAPSGIRTRATTLKGWRPGPLVDGCGRCRIAVQPVYTGFRGPVAQSIEQETFGPKVAGSRPARPISPKALEIGSSEEQSAAIP
jgi:hypothetical protein